MSQTMSRMTARGRGFVNKHILKRADDAPARPVTPAPPLPTPQIKVQAAVTPPPRPSKPAPLPRDMGAMANDSREAGDDDMGQVAMSGGASSSEDDPLRGPAGGLAGAGNYMSPTALGDMSFGDSSSESSESSSESGEASAGGGGVPDAGAIPAQGGAGYTTFAPSGMAPAMNYTSTAALQDLSLSESSSESSDESSESEEELVLPQPGPHATVNAERTPTGMKARPTGDEYKGEFNRAGWRGQTPEAAARTDKVTRLYTEQEQQQNELTMGKDGSFRRGGASVAGDTVGYAMDATGRMVGFKESENQIVTTGRDGQEAREQTDQGLSILTGQRGMQPNQRLEMIHHSTVLGGDVEKDADGNEVLDPQGKKVMKSRPAASAGFVQFNYLGQIVKISNCSGHYKPTVDQLAQAIEYLTKEGAFFKDEVTDAEGNTLNRGSKERLLYEATQQKLTKIESLAGAITSTTALLQQAEEAGNERTQKAAGAKLEELAKELETAQGQVKSAKAVLGKLGVGPSNRMRPEARAEFVAVSKGMTGAGVRTASTDTMNVGEFARTGGGNTQQADRKKAAMAELTSFSQKDRDRILELEGKTLLSDKEAKELQSLTKRRAGLRTGRDANKEAVDRAADVAAKTKPAPEPDIDAEMAKMGVQYDPTADFDSSEESSEDSDSESESSSS